MTRATGRFRTNSISAIVPVALLALSTLPASADTLLEAAARLRFLDEPVTVEGNKALYKNTDTQETHVLTVNRCVITDLLKGSNLHNLVDVLPYEYELTYDVSLMKITQAEPIPMGGAVRMHFERAWPSAERAYCINGYMITMNERGTRIENQTTECRPEGWYQVRASGSLEETAAKAKAAFDAFQSACLSAHQAFGHGRSGKRAKCALGLLSAMAECGSPSRTALRGRSARKRRHISRRLARDRRRGGDFRARAEGNSPPPRALNGAAAGASA